MYKHGIIYTKLPECWFDIAVCKSAFWIGQEKVSRFEEEKERIYVKHAFKPKPKQKHTDTFFQIIIKLRSFHPISPTRSRFTWGHLASLLNSSPNFAMIFHSEMARNFSMSGLSIFCCGCEIDERIVRRTIIRYSVIDTKLTGAHE